MVTFFNLGQQGRLGNQLFQYAALKGLAIKNGYTVKIPDPTTREWHGQTCLLNEFNIDVEFLTKEDLNNIQYGYEESSPYEEDNNFFKLPDNINIDGFFQSIYYFDHCQDQIKKELTPKQIYIDKATNYINDLKAQYPDYSFVSVHLRRGDNVMNGNSAYSEAYNDDGLYMKYFQQAKEVFKDLKVKFIIFTGGARGNEDNKLDIDWCKNKFVGDEYIFSENQKQLDDFARIMMCDHNIISHVSSFGWWAAYTNPNPNKIVVAPKQYDPERNEMTKKMFYPENYTLI